MAVLGRSLQAVSEVIQQIEEPALTIGLDINIEKNEKVYQEVTDFKYLGSIIASYNNCERDIKARKSAGNRCYYALTKIMKLREISKSTKLKIYRTIIRPIVMYSCEGWTIPNI
jgi:hypothetical protein